MTKANEAVKAADEASKAKIAAEEAQQKADQAAAEKTPEQKKADELKHKADDAAAKAAELGAIDEQAKAVPTTATDAGVLGVVESDKLMAGDYEAQKFANDPANPKPAPGVDMNEKTVKLKIQRLNEPDIFCEVPEKMVGDYERAGWNRV